MSSRSSNRKRQTRNSDRSRTRGGQVTRNPRQAASGCDKPPTRTAPARSRPDYVSWNREMRRLRWISLLLGASPRRDAASSASGADCWRR
jgi:hypothetical protein